MFSEDMICRRNITTSYEYFNALNVKRKMYAAKGSAAKTSKGHIKTMFCPYCHCDQNFIQIDTK